MLNKYQCYRSESSEDEAIEVIARAPNLAAEKYESNWDGERMPVTTVFVRDSDDDVTAWNVEEVISYTSTQRSI